MSTLLRFRIALLCSGVFAAPLFGQTKDPPPRGRAAEADQAVPTTPLPLIGITPCRIADTRGKGFTGAYGPPSLSAGEPRSFTLTGQCGIAATASAVSLNITVTATQGAGFIKIYPKGATPPVVSTLNYVANQTVANAAVVPLGTDGGITVVAGVSGTQLIIDTNGYYDDVGLITRVSPGAGLTGGGNSGEVTLGVDFAGSGTEKTAARSDHKHSAVDLVSGTLADGRLGGTYSNALTLSNPSNAFTGNGAGLTNVDAAKLAGKSASAFQPHYVRTVVVGPVGTAVQNGTALLDALAGISTASAVNPWLVHIEPGIYDLGALQLGMKPFVDIEGSGELTTRVRSQAGIAAIGSSNAELRFLTIESSGSAGNPAGISIFSTSPILRHVTILVSGGIGTNVGVVGSGAQGGFFDVTINVTATAPSGTAVGMDLESSSSPTIRNVAILADAAGGNGSYGIIALLSSSIRASDVSVRAMGGASFNVGVSVSSSSAILTRVSSTATGPSLNRGASFNESTGVTIVDSNFIATGGTNDVGLDASGSASPILVIRNSRIGGDFSIGVGGNAFVRIGVSELDGPATVGAGASVGCVGVYDGSFTPLDAACS
jgi:hypothetical protein